MQTQKYIKKRLPVDAGQWNGEVFFDGPLAGVIHSVYTLYDGSYGGLINTLEGQLHIQSGVYIVGPGHRGEYWPVQADFFEATYELDGSDASTSI